MKTKLDAAGRVAATPMRLKRRGRGVVAVADTELPVLTAEQVRDTLERVRGRLAAVPKALRATGARRGFRGGR